MNQEMSQMSIVRESDKHETFESMNLESFFKDLEWETYKRKWVEKYGYELED